MGDELTPTNFIQRIKDMDKSERNKLKLKEVLDLIVQAPLFTVDENAAMKNMQTEISTLTANFKVFSALATKNQEEIVLLKGKNEQLDETNTKLRDEVATLKEQVKPDENNDIDDNIALKLESLETSINEIEQYLRINNLEIVGLPEPNEEAEESDEDLILNAINSLQGLSQEVRSEDIDISHPLKSNRRDHKHVHVVKFISRKTKADILAAKKAVANKNFKFRGNDVFINEHLSKTNRGLFATAYDKKQTLGYKHLWTRGGSIFMRKTDESQVIHIISEKDFVKIV